MSHGMADVSEPCGQRFFVDGNTEVEQQLTPYK